MLSHIPGGTDVSMNGKTLSFGSTISQMRDANDILNDTAALHERMKEDGYLLFRRFYDRDDILPARHEVMSYMAEQGLLQSETPHENGMIGPGNRATNFRHHIIHTRFPSFLSVVNSARIMSFFERYLDGPILSLDHKILRAVGHGHHTAPHYDVVFMGKGTKQLYTVWTAFGDIPLEMGPLAVCLGSHRLERLKATYGAADAHDDLLAGFFTDDPYEAMETLGIRWASTTFEMGDIVIFGMYFMHASLDNKSDRYRLTSDTRYQLASDPVDERHMGETPDVIPKAEKRKTMEEARKEWGI